MAIMKSLKRVPAPLRDLTMFLAIIAAGTCCYLWRYHAFLAGVNAHFAEDFAVFYRAAGWFNHAIASPYAPQDIAHFLRGEPSATGSHPFLYPPFFLFLLAPLSLLSYGA